MTGPKPLGDSDEFALEAQYHGRDDGTNRETLAEKVPEPFAFVEFVGSGERWVVHTDPASADYIIDAELAMVQDTEAHDVAVNLAKALDGTNVYVAHQLGTRDYYLAGVTDG